MTKFSAPQQSQLAQIGAFLRENREKQEKSLEDIAIRTYIRPQLLNGIETGNPDTLPEPIFVQGFIRRYAEALGLNGVELSQQFTVTSIPSTPRPAPAAPIPDTPTTRLTRASASQIPDTQIPNTQIPDTQIPNIQSAPSIPTMPAASTAAGVSAGAMAAQDLTLGRLDNDPMAANAAPETAPADYAHEFDSAVGDIAQSNVPEHSFTESGSNASTTDFEAQLDEMTQPEADTDIPVLSTPTTDEPIELDPTLDAEEQDFSSMVAAFDKENMAENTVQTELPDAESSVPLNATPLNATLKNSSFDDDLPAAFTTQATGQLTDQSSASAVEPAELSAPAMGRSLGLDYEDDQPNLKPFVIGGILAAIALLGVLIASVIGGSRQPSVVDNAAPTEQASADSELPPLPEEAEIEASPEPEVTAPAISDAPVYVEATATREAWVSIIADGETIFEDILQPGDSQVWEAQESLSVYSGDAGALELAANGAEAEVMGEPGQPDEKVFP